MSKGTVIVDSGPIFSLAIIDKLNLLDELFQNAFIPELVWDEITQLKSQEFQKNIYNFFQNKIVKANNILNYPIPIDAGEAAAIILFKEIGADFLLIDDKKARVIAENLNIQCVGTLSILIKAKEIDLIVELKPLFEKLIRNKRYYSIQLLNNILESQNESKL